MLGAILLVGFSQCGRESRPQVERALERVDAPARVVAVSEGDHTAATAGRSLRGATPPDLSNAVPAGFTVPTHQPRDFNALSDEEKAALQRLVEEFWRSGEPDRRAEILDEIEASFYSEEILAFVEKILGLEDESLRQRAVALLAGNTAASILPVLAKALADSSSAVRIDAVGAVAQVRHDAVVEFLGKAFADREAAVRHAGFDVLEDQTQNRKLKVLGRALQAPHADVQTAAIGQLQVESTRASVEVLFDALDAGDPEVRADARFAIDFLVNQEFSSAAEARAWWTSNKSKFGEDLVPSE